MFLLWNKLFYDTFGATLPASSQLLFPDRVGARSSSPPPRRSALFFFPPLFLLLKVKSPSEIWQLLVGISISAAVEADYMGVVPHTGSDMNPPAERGDYYDAID